MLLLVTKDAWKIPEHKHQNTSLNDTDSKTHRTVTISQTESQTQMLPENMQRCFSEVDVLRVHRIKEKLQDLRPLIVSVIILRQITRHCDTMKHIPSQQHCLFTDEESTNRWDCERARQRCQRSFCGCSRKFQTGFQRAALSWQRSVRQGSCWDRPHQKMTTAVAVTTRPPSA